MTKTNKIKLFICSLVVTTLISGCAWQRIPAMPTYNVSKTIPIRVGVVLGDASASFENGSGVVRNLKEMKIFNEIVFPYEKSSQVDGILKMDISGGWNSSTPYEFVKGAIIGLSMGTLGTVLGSSGTGTHDAIVTLNKGSIEVAKYYVHVKTTVECGLKADLNDVDYKARCLQQRKLAVEIAKHISDDYSRISEEFKK